MFNASEYFQDYVKLLLRQFSLKEKSLNSVKISKILWSFSWDNKF